VNCLNNYIIDTHCHLDDEKFDEDLDDVIQRAHENGVTKMIIPGADINDLDKAKNICEQYDGIYFAVGVHPYHIEQYDEKYLESFISHEKCVAAGECGLDYYRLPEDEGEKEQNKQQQKEVFTAHIELALKHQKPLIIHVRDANQDTYDILKNYDLSKTKAVFHCFNASELLLSLEPKGFYYGIGGVLTFKNAKNLVEILPKIPQEKILLETDAPYLTPHPYRGKRNEPSYTRLVAHKVCELLDIDIAQLSTITTNNANTIFGEL
jgi:TatD DNase family protein